MAKLPKMFVTAIPAGALRGEDNTGDLEDGEVTFALFESNTGAERYKVLVDINFNKFKRRYNVYDNDSRDLTVSPVPKKFKKKKTDVTSDAYINALWAMNEKNDAGLEEALKDLTACECWDIVSIEY